MEEEALERLSYDLAKSAMDSALVFREGGGGQWLMLRIL